MANRLNDRVSDRPALASDSSTGPRSFSSATMRPWSGAPSRRQRTELAELVDSIDQRVTLTVDHASASGMVSSAFRRGFLRSELTDQPIEAVGGRNDVPGLIVDVADGDIELCQQAT